MVVAQTRHLTVEQLGWVDRAVAADVEGFTRCDADGQLAAVAELVDRARPDLHKAKQQRRYERSFLSLQPGLDGSLQVYGEFDPEAGAAILERLDAPGAGETEIGEDAESDLTDVSGWGRSKGPAGEPSGCIRRVCTAAAPVRSPATAATSRTSTRSAPTTTWAARVVVGRGSVRARPSLLVLTPVDRLAEDVCSSSAAHLAQLLWRTARGPVSLSDAAVQRLACDATLRQVLTDGHDVLGVAAPTETIPTRVRAALWARDAGCRFPGCRAPAQWTDGHHVRWRSKGGPTTIENLVLLCRRHHRAVHEGGWHLSFTPEDGVVTVRRGDRQFLQPRARRPGAARPTTTQEATPKARGSVARPRRPTPTGPSGRRLRRPHLSLLT